MSEAPRRRIRSGTGRPGAGRPTRRDWLLPCLLPRHFLPFRAEPWVEKKGYRTGKIWDIKICRARAASGGEPGDPNNSVALRAAAPRKCVGRSCGQEQRGTNLQGTFTFSQVCEGLHQPGTTPVPLSVLVLSRRVASGAYRRVGLQLCGLDDP